MLVIVFCFIFLEWFILLIVVIDSIYNFWILFVNLMMFSVWDESWVIVN